MGLGRHPGSGWTGSDRTALQVNTNTAACSYRHKSTLGMQEKAWFFLLRPCDSCQIKAPTRVQKIKVFSLTQTSKQTERKGYRGFRSSGAALLAPDLPEASVCVWTVLSVLPQAAHTLQHATLLVTDMHSWLTVKKGKRRGKLSPRDGA